MTFYTNKKGPGEQDELLSGHIYEIIGKKMNVTFQFVQQLENSLWLFEESYFGHIGIGVNACLDMLQ